MAEKIKVSKGIANVIDRYITRNIKNYELSLESAMEDLIVCHPNIDWEDYLDGEFKELENITTYDLMQVLVLGYEVEKTPEDKVREIYSTYNVSDDISPAYSSCDIADVIIDVLDGLDIKIEGVNN